MKALFVEYTIVEVKEKNIKILMPSRALIGQEENNVMTVGEEKLSIFRKPTMKTEKNAM